MQKTFFILCFLTSFTNHGMEQKTSWQAIPRKNRSIAREESSLVFHVGSIPSERENSPMETIDIWSFSPAGLALKKELELDTFKARLTQVIKNDPEIQSLKPLIIGKFMHNYIAFDDLDAKKKKMENKKLDFLFDQEDSLDCFFPLETKDFNN